MRSSSAFALIALWLTACSATPPQPAMAATDSLECRIAGAAPGAAMQNEIRALRRSVEVGPIFVALAARSPAHCEVNVDDGQLSLSYRFGDAASLRVERNMGIEYTDQTARAPFASRADAMALVARAERASFGGQGCGIDWSTAEARLSAGERVLVYRGTSCNCQARVLEDAAGRVVGIGLRSAC